MWERANSQLPRSPFLRRWPQDRPLWRDLTRSTSTQPYGKWVSRPLLCPRRIPSQSRYTPIDVAIVKGTKSIHSHPPFSELTSPNPAPRRKISPLLRKNPETFCSGNDGFDLTRTNENAAKRRRPRTGANRYSLPMWIIGLATIRVTADNTSINAGICRRPSLTISIGLSLFSIRYHEQRILVPGGYCDLCSSPDKFRLSSCGKHGFPVDDNPVSQDLSG